MQQRSDDGKQCGIPWSGLENESEEVESQRKSEKEKKCKVRYSLVKKNEVFQKSCTKVGGSRSCCQRVWCQQEHGECMLWRWLPRKS